ncbi:MAG: hypothetical protein M0R66_02490 [Candidatus Omnitrophica bacterium]|jgi:hypothetical protein|nr:hypothetical protein [Sphaerochaeta sp.]MCK9603236.1 hypothetical protein [Candidatus Omnitrophota bacterium]
MATNAGSKTITDQELFLEILKGVKETMAEGFKGVNQRFDTMEERLRAAATNERLESEIKRLDREDCLNRDAIKLLRDDAKLETEKAIQSFRWRWGAVVSAIAVGISLLGAFVLD